MGRPRKTERDYHALARRRGFVWSPPVPPNIATKCAWTCACGHKWRAVYNAIDNGKGCPVCARSARTGPARRVSISYNLATEDPVLASAWHPHRNAPLSARNVSPSAHRRVWWQCPANPDHQWLNTVNALSRRKIRARVGCPFCLNKTAGHGNSLADVDPELSTEWDQKKNQGLRATELLPSSGRKVWWLCRFGHSWRASPSSRRSQGRHGCPYCSKQSSRMEIRVLTELQVLFSDVAWRAKVNGAEVDVLLPSMRVAIEVDGERYHEGKKTADRAKTRLLEKAGYRVVRLREGALAPLSPSDICFPKSDSHRQTVRRLMSLLATIASDRATRSRLVKASEVGLGGEKRYRQVLSEMPMPPVEDSLASKRPDLLGEWDTEKNRPLTPAHFTPGSKKRVWWRCPRGHEGFVASIQNRASGHVGCPSCSGHRAAPDNRLAAVLPKLKPQWDYAKNALDPAKISRSSIAHAWWKCRKCGHSWKTTIWRVSRKGTNCQLCVNRAHGARRRSGASA